MDVPLLDLPNILEVEKSTLRSRGIVILILGILFLGLSLAFLSAPLVYYFSLVGLTYIIGGVLGIYVASTTKTYSLGAYKTAGVVLLVENFLLIALVAFSYMRLVLDIKKCAGDECGLSNRLHYFLYFLFYFFLGMFAGISLIFEIRLVGFIKKVSKLQREEAIAKNLTHEV